jgi:hypothetical protein
MSFQMPQRFNAAHSSEGAGGRERDFVVRIINHRDQHRYDLVSRADAATSCCAHRGGWVSQQIQRDVAGQNNVELRRDSESGYQCRALNDLLGDQPGNGMLSFLTADSAERVERRDLLRHRYARAVPDESIAE